MLSSASADSSVFNRGGSFISEYPSLTDPQGRGQSLTVVFLIFLVNTQLIEMHPLRIGRYTTSKCYVSQGLQE